jgi:hypothetical protein
VQSEGHPPSRAAASVLGRDRQSINVMRIWQHGQSDEQTEGLKDGRTNQQIDRQPRSARSQQTLNSELEEDGLAGWQPIGRPLDLSVCSPPRARNPNQLCRPGTSKQNLSRWHAGELGRQFKLCSWEHSSEASKECKA